MVIIIQKHWRGYWARKMLNYKSFLELQNSKKTNIHDVAKFDEMQQF